MRYITKEQVAELLRVSVRTITSYMNQGLLPTPVRLGRKLLWDEDKLVAFLQPKVFLAAISTNVPALPPLKDLSEILCAGPEFVVR